MPGPLETWAIFFTILIRILLLAALVYGVFWAAEWWHRSRQEKSPLTILEERYARGEIDAAEFAERRDVLLNRGADSADQQTD